MTHRPERARPAQFNRVIRKQALVVAVLVALAGCGGNAIRPAAPGSVLDTSAAARIVQGPRISATYRQSLVVQPGNVVEIAGVLRNVGQRPTLKARLRFIIPTDRGTKIGIFVDGISPGAHPKAPYKSSSITWLTSSSTAFRLNPRSIRSVQLQQNRSAQPNTIYWGPPRPVAHGEVDAVSSSEGVEMIVAPRCCRHLDVHAPSDTIKITFLVDVVPASAQLGLEMKARTSSSSFQHAESVRPGEALQFFVQLRELGGGTGHDVVLRAALPPGISLISGSVRLRSSANPALRAGTDNFVNGGLRYLRVGAGSWVQVFFNARVGRLPPGAWEKVFALVRSDETYGVEYGDSVKLTVARR